MARIISVINDKGGVAKTTTVMNLGTALWLLDKKVLLVDADPQCNLTLAVDKTAIQTDCNLYTWMRDINSPAPVFERYKGLDYIPGSSDIAFLEDQIRGMAGADRQMQIRLNALNSQYDYILIDCAPGSQTIVNMNAIGASDGLIVPIRSDLFSIAGRGALMNKVAEFRLIGKQIAILGVLLTQYDPRTEMGKRVKEYYKENAEKNTDMPLFPVEIRKCEAVNKSHASQMSIFEYDSNATVADDYMRLAEIVDNGYPYTRPKKWTPSIWSYKACNAYETFIKTQLENL